MKRWSICLGCLLVGGVVGTYVAGPRLFGQNTDGSTDRSAVVTNIPKDMSSYSPVVKKVLPAVVSITSRAKQGGANRGRQFRRMFPDDGGIPPELRRFFEDFNRPQQQPFSDDEDGSPALGLGSGVVVDPKGVILTNFHVVDGADQVQVVLEDGRKFMSRDIKGDAKSDLAIVRLKTDQPLPYLELGDSDAMQIGDRVLAVGNPFGLSGTVTAGIISAKGRHLQMNMYEDFLQTDAAINPGNSGGPLVNLAGQVVGINSAIKSRTGGFQGIGLAVASNLAKNIEQQLLKHGTVRRGYLGVRISDLEPAVADKMGLKTKHGVVVGDVNPDTPASKAGLRPGDIIISINGKEVKDGTQLQTVVAGLPLGKPVDVDIIRDGKPEVVKVTVEQQPNDFGPQAKRGERRSPRSESEEPETAKLSKVGLEVAELTSDLADQLGYKDSDKGVVVVRVESESPSQDAGLRRGMLITRVDRRPVTSVSAFRRLIERSKDSVVLQVKTPRGGVNYLELKTQPAAR
jgi:serine protease Do